MPGNKKLMTLRELNTVRLLRSLIREQVASVADTAAEAPAPKPEPDYAAKVAAKLASMQEGGLGILTEPYGSKGVEVVLYKTNIFVGNVLANIDTESEGPTAEDVARRRYRSMADSPRRSGSQTSDAIFEATKKSIVGMITLDEPPDNCNDALLVKYVFAEKGYGPMMYEIAMQLSPSGRIMSDRNAVSNDARKVYGIMHKRSDVVKKQFDDNLLPMHKRKTPNDPSDDCEVWNHKDKRPDSEILDYSFQGSGNVDLNALFKNHEEAMATLNKYVQKYLRWGPGFAKKFITDVSNMMFMSVYHATPVTTRGLKNQ